MVKIEVSKFTGKPLIKKPDYNPDVDFLRGDFGRDVDHEVRSRYQRFPIVFKDVNFVDGIV